MSKSKSTEILNKNQPVQKSLRMAINCYVRRLSGTIFAVFRQLRKLN